MLIYLQTKKAKVRRMAQEQSLSWDEGTLDQGLKIIIIKHMFKPEEFEAGKVVLVFLLGKA